jgi:cytochrome c553
MKKIIALLCGAALTSALCVSGAAVAGNAAAGKEKAKVCAACHGADGNTPVADNPKLAGQHPDYIIKALQGYKSGTRKSPIMAPMGSNLSQRDMEDLAAYFSSQQGLTTFK